MRKSITLIILALIISSYCCGQTEPTKKQTFIQTQTDSLNYTLGVISGFIIKEECFKEKPLEECISIFMKYFDDGFTSEKKFAKPDSTNKYSQIMEAANKSGRAFKSQQNTGFMNLAEFKVDLKLIKIGFEAGMRSDFSIMSAESSQNYLQKTLLEINIKNNRKEIKQNNIHKESKKNEDSQ